MKEWVIVKMLKKGYKFSMATNLAVGTVLIILLVILIVGLKLYDYMHTSIQKNYINQYNQVFSQTNARISKAVQDVVRMAATLNTNPKLIGAVNLSFTSDTPASQLQNKKAAQDIMKMSVGFQSYINNVAIYTKNHSVLMNETETSAYRIDIPNETWFKNIYNGGSKNIFLPNYRSKNNYFVSYNRSYYNTLCVYAVAFNNTVISKTPSVLLISLEHGYLSDLLGEIDKTDGKIIALLDEDDRLIYAADDHTAAFLEKTPLDDKVPSGGTMLINGEKYFFIRHANNSFNWSLIALIPQKVMYKDISSLQTTIFTVSLIAILIGLGLTLFISRSIIHPFHRLMESMDNAGECNALLEIKPSPIREVHELVNRYNIMLQRISELIERIKAIEREKRNTEFAALRSQIHPHFMYNTLESIRWAALMQNAPQTAKMISSFVRLLKLTAGHRGEFIPVSSEIEQVKHYAEIMAFRYNSRIDLVFSVDEGVLQCKTLGLLLQPVVENCFTHGFENFEKPGVIKISAYTQDNRLFYTVEDNGRGMELEEGALPQSSESQGDHLHRGIGLSYVNERIKLWFGADYGITFKSSPGKGTSVTITQPLQAESEKEEKV